MAKVRETLYVEIAVSVEYDTDIVENVVSTFMNTCRVTTIPAEDGITICASRVDNCQFM